MVEEIRAEARPATVGWRPMSGPQAALITCSVFEVFFGGSRGSLKTDSMLGDWGRHSMDYGPNAIGLMIRRTREELSETFERFKLVLEPMGFEFSGYHCTGPTGSRLTFAYLAQDLDADRYQGWSLTRVYVEEIGNFPRQAPVMKLMATLRSSAGVPCCFRATGNPGGPGHQWVKERYIEPAPLGWEPIEYEYTNPFDGSTVTKSRMFLPGKITDHNLLGPEYIANLQMSGGEALVRAWLLGDWDVVEGAFFDGWSEKLIIKPFSIPEHWTKFISGDWGFAAPFSFGWWAVASEDFQTPEGNQIPKGAMVRYREYYGKTAANVGIRKDADVVGLELREKTGDEVLSTCVIDPAAFGSQSGPSVAEDIVKGASDFNWKQHHPGKPPGKPIFFRPADNKRVAGRGAIGGWNQMRGRITGAFGMPMIYCFSTCTDSIRTIPALQHDRDKPEDLDTAAEDHAADEWRYACMSRPYTRPKPGTPEPVFDYKGDSNGQIIVGNVSIREMIDRKAREREDA